MEIDFSSSMDELEKAFTEANEELDKLFYERCALDAKESFVRARIEYYNQIRNAMETPYYRKLKEAKCDTER